MRSSVFSSVFHARAKEFGGFFVFNLLLLLLDDRTTHELIGADVLRRKLIYHLYPGLIGSTNHLKAYFFQRIFVHIVVLE